MGRSPSERWRVTFEAAGDGPPIEVRMKKLLKAALRAYGLRNVGCEPVPAPAARQATPGPSPGPEATGP